MQQLLQYDSDDQKDNEDEQIDQEKNDIVPNLPNPSNSGIYTNDSAQKNSLEAPLRPTFLRDSNMTTGSATSSKLRYTEVDNGLFDIGIGGIYNKDFNSNENENVVKEEYKVFFIGDFGTGKSSIISRFVNNKFGEDDKEVNNNNDMTTYKKSIQVNQQTVINFTIEDTSGIERSSSVPRQFYLDLHGIIVVFDITNEESFKHVNKWIKSGLDHSPKDVVMFLVGNKKDLEEQRKVTENQAEVLIEKYKEKYKTAYFEVSAATGSNVQLIFEELADKISIRQKETKDDKVQRAKERESIGAKSLSSSQKRKRQEKCVCNNN